MVGYDPNRKELDHRDHVVAGAASGIFTRFFTQPLDVLKIRFQLQVEPISKKSHQSKYRGAYHSLHTITKEERLRAFWKGHAAAQGLTAVFMAAEFTAFEILTKEFSLRMGKDKHKTNHFFSGAAAGGFATLVSYPLDVIRTRFIAQGNQKMYHSFHQAVRHIYTTDGILGFYRGLWPTMMHTIPQSALYFGCYESYKQIVRPFLIANNRDGDSLNPVCGAAAGVTAKLLVYPFDTAKRRLQVIGFEKARAGFGVTNYYKGLTHYLQFALQQEGIMGFYKGASWALLKSGVSTAMFFYFYETFCSSIRFYKESSK